MWLGIGLGRVGVEGADDRSAAEGVWRPRRRAARAGSWTWTTSKRPARSSRRSRDRALREADEVGDGAVRADADGAAERHEVVGSVAELGRGAVQAAADGVRRVPGGEHANVVASGDELLRQRLDVPVHAPLVGPGIGRNQGDAHAMRVPAPPAVSPCDPARSLPGGRRRRPGSRACAIVPMIRNAAPESLATVPSTMAPAAPAKPARAERLRGEPGEHPPALPGDHGDRAQHEPEQGLAGRPPEAAGREPQAALEDVGELVAPARLQHRAGEVRVAAEHEVEQGQRAPARPRARRPRAARGGAAPARPAPPARRSPRRAGKHDRGADVRAEPARRRRRRASAPPVARKAATAARGEGGRPSSRAAARAAPVPTDGQDGEAGLELVADPEEARPRGRGSARAARAPSAGSRRSRRARRRRP